ncbi:MAG: RNA-binding protein [Burkholderiales bacterium]|jgi:RNA recognition motif-containing protein|nr:RNA-binding protein [Burkholderiales bacterium]
MAKLLVGNLPPDTKEEDLKALLVKYGFPPFTSMEAVAGDGSRPAAALEFEGVAAETLRKLAPRVHDLFWVDRRINVLVP